MDAKVTNAHQGFDRLNAMMLTAMEERGTPATCRDGCFFCCKEPSYVDRREVIQMLRTLTPEQIERVSERTWAWAERFALTRLPFLEEPHVLEYRAANLWCPLLENGRCMAYAHRPLACRSHTAIGPVERCEKDELRMSQQFANSPEIAMLATQALTLEAEEIYMDNLGVHLVELLHGVRMHSSSRLIMRAPKPETGHLVPFLKVHRTVVPDDVEVFSG